MMTDMLPIREGTTIASIVSIIERIDLVKTVDHYAGKETHKNNGPTIGQRVAVMTINRLLAPEPLYKVSDWYRESGLENYFGCTPEEFNDDALGYALEKIEQVAFSITSKVLVDVALAFEIGVQKVYHDVTSISFEGEYKESEIVKYGYNREKRPDLKQVNVHLDVETTSCVPVGFGIYAGNTADAKTTLPAMEGVKCNYDLSKIVFIGDEAMHDMERLSRIDSEGGKFVVGARKTEKIKKMLQDVNKEKMRSIKGMEGYKGRILCRGFDGQKNWRVHVVYSPTYEQQQRETRERHMAKVNEVLEKVKKYAGTKYYDTAEKIVRKVHEVLGKYKDVKKYYRINVLGKKASLKWEIDNRLLSEDEKMDGLYCLLENAGLETAEALKTYKTKCVVDVAMHSMKKHLKTSPVFLKKDARIRGMAVIWFLALLIRSLLEYEVNRKAEKEMYETAKKFPCESVKRAISAKKRGEYRITFEVIAEILLRVWVLIQRNGERKEIAVMNMEGLAQKVCAAIGIDTAYIVRVYSMAHRTSFG